MYVIHVSNLLVCEESWEEGWRCTKKNRLSLRCMCVWGRQGRHQQNANNLVQEEISFLNEGWCFTLLQKDIEHTDIST